MGRLRLRRAALVLLVALCGCSEPTAKDEPEGRVVTFGHSFVQGRYPDPALTPWPDRLAAKLRRPLSNRGVGGAESPAVAERVDAYAPRAEDVVVVEAALNDVRHFGRRGLPRYRRSLTRILDHLTTAAERPSVALLVDPPILAWRRYAPYDHGSTRALHAYGRATRAAGARYRVRVVDLGRHWDPARDIASDGIHPNAAGTARIAEVVAAAVG